MQVERERFSDRVERRTGEYRVRIYPLARDNNSKGLLIPDVIHGGKSGPRDGLTPGDELASYQLVGEVMAHQGDDG